MFRSPIRRTRLRTLAAAVALALLPLGVTFATATAAPAAQFAPPSGARRAEGSPIQTAGPL